MAAFQSNGKKSGMSISGKRQSERSSRKSMQKWKRGETHERGRKEKVLRRKRPLHPRQPLRANICRKGENGTGHREQALEICESKSLFMRVIRVVIREITKGIRWLVSALSDGSYLPVPGNIIRLFSTFSSSGQIITLVKGSPLTSRVSILKVSRTKMRKQPLPYPSTLAN